VVEPVFAVLEDHEGTVWVGGVGKVCAIRGTSVECDEVTGSSGNNYMYGNRGRAVYSLHEDRDGVLWAGADSGLWRWRPGPPQRYLPQPFISQQSLAQGDQATGILAVLGNDGMLRQIAGHEVQQYAAAADWRGAFAYRMLRDRNGSLWIGTLNQGLILVRDGRLSRFGRDNGLSDKLVASLFEDREGSIWIGTPNGLDRFHEPAFATISASRGVSKASPMAPVLAARDGSIWIGSQDGMYRWNQGHVTVYRSVATSKARRAPHMKEGVPGRDEATEIVDPELPGNLVASLFQDPSGRIWVTCNLGAAWFENGRFHRVEGMPSGTPNTIITDSSGGIWISSPVHGLFRVVEGKVVESTPWPWSKGGNDPRLSALVADKQMGGIWLGFLNGGIAYFKEGQVRQSFGPKEGLGSGPVWGLHIDHEGTLWVSTEGGVSRVRDTHIETLTSRNGLPCDFVRWASEDDDFSLWLYTGCGLVRIARSELLAWISESKHQIHPIVFDGTDGVRLHTFINGADPLMNKAADGALWFAHLDGVSVIDPHHLRRNSLPPPVHIEQMTADGSTYGATPGLRLPPQVRNLSLHYTALSLVAPEKVRFRFKLEGQDPEWREVLNERDVQYSNLAPGSYRFRVTASNNSDVWNERGASLDFSIAAAYYQTIWFRSLCVAAFLASLWALYRMRMQQLAREATAAHESERRQREVQTALAHANRLAAMGQVTASIAHEVNQPIGATVANAEAALNWLSRESPDLEQVKQALGWIVKDGARAGEVISRVRAMIKKEPAKKENVALNDAIVDVVAMTRGEAVKHGISVRTELAGGLPTIQGDRVQLQQVVLNLIINAIEAMSGTGDGAGELLIRTEAGDAGNVLVTVADSGPGLSPTAFEELFEPFYTTKPNGLGLGLSICRSIVEAHGGQLSARANMPRGSIFQFSVPSSPGNGV
jgi:signal transduction histidine kinase/ligand-binding sensor domain-containing protein